MADLIRLRQEAADRIENLLAFIDATDGIEDLELNGDEEEPANAGDIFARPETDETEADDCDDEPWLGRPEPTATWDVYGDRAGC